MSAKSKAKAAPKQPGENPGTPMRVIFCSYFGKSVELLVEPDESAWLQAEPTNDER